LATAVTVTNAVPGSSSKVGASGIAEKTAAARKAATDGSGKHRLLARIVMCRVVGRRRDRDPLPA
jgi:hypothetical protein